MCSHNNDHTDGYLNIAELEKKLAELQKYVKNEGEKLPEWLSLESEEDIKSPKVSLVK